MILDTPGDNTQVVLINCNRTATDILLREELETLAGMAAAA